MSTAQVDTAFELLSALRQYLIVVLSRETLTPFADKIRLLFITSLSDLKLSDEPVDFARTAACDAYFPIRGLTSYPAWGGQAEDQLRTSAHSDYGQISEAPEDLSTTQGAPASAVFAALCKQEPPDGADAISDDTHYSTPTKEEECAEQAPVGARFDSQQPPDALLSALSFVTQAATSLSAQYARSSTAPLSTGENEDDFEVAYNDDTDEEYKSPEKNEDEESSADEDDVKQEEGEDEMKEGGAAEEELIQTDGELLRSIKTEAEDGEMAFSAMCSPGEVKQGAPLYECDICKMPFCDGPELRRHNKVHTAISKAKKLYTCKECGKDYTSSSGLFRHMQFHRGQSKRYPCSLCEKSYTSTSHLQAHIRVHTGEKPYICDICDKAFSVNSSLQKHKLLHLEEKGYRCSVCAREFRHGSNLRIHMRVRHTTERPFVCETCGSTFAVLNTLKEHNLIHIGEKNYACTLCDKKFLRRSTLREHEHTHSTEKPFKCDLCDLKFSQRRSLKSHTKRMHYT